MRSHQQNWRTPELSISQTSSYIILVDIVKLRTASRDDDGHHVLVNIWPISLGGDASQLEDAQVLVDRLSISSCIRKRCNINSCCQVVSQRLFRDLGNCPAVYVALLLLDRSVLLTFGMSMKMGVPYSMSNTVIEFEPDRRIAWQTVLRRVRSAASSAGASGATSSSRSRAAPRSPRPGTSQQDKQAFFLKQGRSSASTTADVHVQDAGAAWPSITESLSRPHRRHRRRLGGAGPPRPERVHPHPLPLPRLRPRLGRARRHRCGGRAAGGLGQGPGAGARSSRSSSCPGRTPVLLIDNGGTGDPILDLRPHGQAAAARRVARRARPVRAGARGRPPLRPGHGRRRLRPRSPPSPVCWRPAAAEGRVLILIEASEESGSPDLSAYVGAPRASASARPRLVICLDSGGLSYDRLWLTSSLRGQPRRHA